MELHEAIDYLRKGRDYVKLEVDNGALEYEPYVQAVNLVTDALDLITSIVKTNMR